MTVQDYFDHMNRGEPVTGGGELHKLMREINEETMRLTFDLNSRYHTQSGVREIFSKIIGKPVDKSFRLFSPPSTPTAGRTPPWGKTCLSTPAVTFRIRGALPLGTAPS